MRHVGIVTLFLLIACSASVNGAPAKLRVPALEAGGKVFSNAVVTASSRNRLLVEHDGGLTSVKLSDLDAEMVRELHSAGIVSDAAAKEILRKAPKKEVAKTLPPESSSDPASTNTVPVADTGFGKRGSIANLLSAEIQKEAKAHGADMDAEAAASMLPMAWRWILSGLLVAAWLCRRCLYFRIVETATGHTSFLVFAPVFRCFPLMNAAHISFQWLLIPLFAIAGLFFPPMLGDSPQVILGYYSLVGLLWLGTGLLYLVWCVRLCQAVDRTGWLALLLIWPVLDWIALFVLASSPGKAQPQQGQSSDAPKRLVLAI